MPPLLCPAVFCFVLPDSLFDWFFAFLICHSTRRFTSRLAGRLAFATACFDRFFCVCTFIKSLYILHLENPPFLCYICSSVEWQRLSRRPIGPLTDNNDNVFRICYSISYFFSSLLQKFTTTSYASPLVINPSSLLAPSLVNNCNSSALFQI